MAATRLFVGDRWEWGEWISVWPTLGWLLLFLPAVLRYRSWVTLLLLVGFVGGTTEWPRNSSAAIVMERDLRVITWNVSANVGFLDALADLKPDLILAQESKRPLGLGVDLHWQGGGEPGTVSRFPIEALPTRPVGPWSEPQLLMVQLPHGRKLLVANVRLMLPAPVLRVANPMGPGEGKSYHALRQQQFPELAQLLKESVTEHQPDGVLLAGDFNSPPHLPSLRPLGSDLTDAWPLAGRGWGGTAPAFLPLARIDQVWVSQSLLPIDAFVEKRPGSDHRALVVDLVFR